MALQGPNRRRAFTLDANYYNFFYGFAMLEKFLKFQKEVVSTSPLRKLFWIGSPFFAPALPACGWEVHFFNFEEVAVYGWEDLVRMAGWVPDVVLVADKSRPPFVLGMEDFPCVTVFYCVDSHIHSYYPLYAQVFDLCLVSLKDHMSLFGGKSLTAEQVWWSPPFASDLSEAPVSTGTPADETADFSWDCLFVGTVDADLNPARAYFLEALAGHIPGLHIARGDYHSLFKQGRILLNHCVGGDLNFRVFEAMGCGGCLLTPLVGHGLHELFTENVHLLTYPPQDVGAAAAQIQALLADPPRQSALRHAALACIDAGHRASHRARAFSHNIRAWYDGPGRERSQQRRRMAPTLRTLWLRMPYLLFAENLSQPVLQQAYVQAAQGCFGEKL